MDRFLAAALSRHSLSRGEGVTVHPDAGWTLGDGVLPRFGIDVGQRPVGIVGRQITVPELREESDGGLPAHLLEAYLVGHLLGFGVGVAEDERGRGQDEQIRGGPPVLARRPLMSR